MSNPFGVELTPQDIANRTEAERTIFMLADQVGVKCVQCGTTIHGHANVGALAWMAPMGTHDFQMQSYCEPCAAGMRGE